MVSDSFAISANGSGAWRSGFVRLPCALGSHFAKHLLPAVNFHNLKTEI